MNSKKKLKKLKEKQNGDIERWSREGTKEELHFADTEFADKRQQRSEGAAKRVTGN